MDSIFSEVPKELALVDYIAKTISETGVAPDIKNVERFLAPYIGTSYDRVLNKCLKIGLIRENNDIYELTNRGKDALGKWIKNNSDIYYEKEDINMMKEYVLLVRSIINSEQIGC